MIHSTNLKSLSYLPKNSLTVSSGTITVNEDSSVQVLAEEAVPVDWIDPQNAKEILSKAQNDLSTANTDEAKAEAQIAIEGR